MAVTSDSRPTGSLAWLIDPVLAEDFFSSHWDRRPLAVRRNKPSYYAHLPGLTEFDGLITGTAGAKSPDGRMLRRESTGHLTRRSFQLTFDGRPDIHDIYRSYGEGYTVVLDRIESRSPEVGALCRRLESDLHHRVGANFYLTPRGFQGSDLHVDSHDVIIAQIHGQKTWRIATDTERLPLAPRPAKPIQIAESREERLEPGDALYIPRGYAHEATAETSSSLHLTIGINVLTLGDLLREALETLVDTCAPLQQPLPYGYLWHPFECSNEAAVLSHYFSGAALLSMMESARVSLGTKVLRRHSATSGHFAALDLIPDLTSDGIMRRAFLGPCRTRFIDDNVIAEYAGNYVSVPRRLAQVLEYALCTPSFSVASMPCDLSEAAKIQLAGRLVREGFLTIVSSGRK